MGFWHWIKQGRKPKNRNRKKRKSLDPNIARAFSRVKRDLRKFESNLTYMHQQVFQQSNRIDANTQQIQHNKERLDKLEDRINVTPAVNTPESPPTNQPIDVTHRLTTINNAEPTLTGNLYLKNLSGQERRILGVFLSHRDMALSYQDIAKELGKSPHTVKNQVRQMLIKAPLWDKTVDSENRNRFKLKRHLEIETDSDTN